MTKISDPCAICQRWREGACMDCRLDGTIDDDHPCLACDKSLDACKVCTVENKLFDLNPKTGDVEFVDPCGNCNKWRDDPSACDTCPNDPLKEQTTTIDPDASGVDWKGYYGTTTYGTGAAYSYPRCSHQDWVAFKDKDGNDVRLFLGSSGVVVPGEVDVYIRLTTNEPDEPYIPKWLRKYRPKTERDEFLVNWYIPDGHPGSDELVQFALNVIEAGLTLGFGCVGGHGRTGWMACRIIKALTQCSGDQALRFLRENYCKKAVESLSQAKDLELVEEQPYYFTTTYLQTSYTPKGGIK